MQSFNVIPGFTDQIHSQTAKEHMHHVNTSTLLPPVQIICCSTHSGQAHLFKPKNNSYNSKASKIKAQGQEMR